MTRHLPEAGDSAKMIGFKRWFRRSLNLIIIILCIIITVGVYYETAPWGIAARINDLTPESAAFWGALFGVGGAVLAVVIGVWLNVRSNRIAMARVLKWEIEHLVSRLQEARYILSGSIVTAQGRGFDDFCGDLLSSVNVTYLRRIVRIPRPQIFQNSAEKTGLLGSSIGRDVAIFYSNMMSFTDRFERDFPEDSDRFLTFIYLQSIEMQLDAILKSGEECVEVLGRYAR